MLRRPDGAEIHWETTGDRGPLVLVVHQLLWSYPQVYGELIGQLAGDHRIVTYDARGCGASSAQGPYDTDTDVADLEAVAEAAGGAAVAIAVGYGFNVVARVAAARPDLVARVLSVQPAAAAILPRHELEGSGVMAASESVMELLMQMMNRDPRSALHSIVMATNPDLGEDELRERLDRVLSYISPEAALPRARAWIDDDASEHVRALGDRLWIVHSEAEPLFEGVLADRVAELYPGARIEQLAGGPISRPDLYAERVRVVTKASGG